MLLFLHQILKVEENKQHLQENLTLIQLISCLFQLALLNNKNLHSRSVFKMFPNTLLRIRWHKNLNTSLKICQNLISWLIDINGVQEICGLERRCQIHTLLGTDPPSANEPTLNEGMGHSGHSLYYPSDTTIVASGFYTSYMNENLLTREGTWPNSGSEDNILQIIYSQSMSGSTSRSWRPLPPVPCEDRGKLTL